MKLLGADIVQDKEDAGTEEKRRRIAHLKEEETKAVKRLNKTLAEEAEVKQRIADEKEAGQPKLKVRKTELSAEVDALEARRRDLMKPISETREQAEKSLQDNIQTGKDLRAKMDEYAQLKDDLTERIEILQESKQEADEKQAELIRREKKVKESEDEIRRSLSELAKKWREYHDAINKSNIALEQREKDVVNAKTNNENFKKSLDERQTDQENRELAIKDKREALDRAWNELSTKQQKQNG